MTELISTSSIVEKNPFSIKKIYVKDLFGYYTYDLSAKEDNSDLSRLFILYGDNGSGKTTILRAVYYLISTIDGQGHKSELANLKFRKLYVRFENDIEIGAERSGSQKIIGGYRIYIRNGKSELFSVHLPADKSNIIKLTSGTEKDKSLMSMYAFIQELNLKTYFLSDDRTIFTDKQQIPSEVIYDADVFYNYKLTHSESNKKKPEDQISLAIDGFSSWIRSKVIDASNDGEKSSLDIYTDLVRSIAASSETATVGNQSKITLIKTLIRLSSKSEGYSTLGLISKPKYKEIIDILTEIKGQRKVEIVNKVLSPYIETLNARLQALEGLQMIILNFISSINQYFSNKIISFHLSKGFELTHIKGGNIKYTELSSGERQMLLLLINTITATEEASIFIIDEPEISLNIKWQRTLLRTLTEFSKNSKVQFLIATHSMELLASNLDKVVKVEEK